MAIITISRGSFAGGKVLARRLGKALGQPVLSREEVLSRAAREYGINESELTTALNESPPFWRQVPGKRLAYVKCVTAALLDHAKDGNLIYNGNVGHLLLAGISHVLRVRVIAELNDRIAAAMDRRGLTRPQAENYIRKVDQDRARWAKLLYGIDWEDPHQYGAIFNLSQVMIDGAVETIVRMTELDAFRPTEESKKHYEDLLLGCRVWAALAKDPKTRSSGIDVTANDGDVKIVGSVRTAEAGELVPKIAKEVDGVKSVVCEAGQGTDWYW